MATELLVFVLVQLTVTALLVRASLVRVTRTGTSAGTRINVNATLVNVINCHSCMQSADSIRIHSTLRVSVDNRCSIRLAL